ncbi:MAG TPA: glycosyltransferase 87 family protein [Acidimicrobiales bacterium]|nr:glycosyltransferase 87 family protein [Acidimicrobiales bacterium]
MLIATVPIAGFVWQTLNRWNRGPLGRLDFRVYYSAAAQHGPLYSYAYAVPMRGARPRPLQLGFTYPPFAALVMRPFTLMRVSTAEQLWFFVSVALTVVFAVLFAQAMPTSVSAFARGVVVACVLVSMPVSLTLGFGQINALIAVLVALELVLIRRGSKLAGAGLGLATALKITPAFIVVALALAGRTRAALMSVLAAVAASVVATIVYPRDSWTYFTRTVFETRRVGRVTVVFNNSLRRVVSSLDLGHLATILLWLLASLAVLGVVVYRSRLAWRNEDALAALTLAALGSYLVSPISWGHHLYFVAPALGLLVVGRTEWWRWAIAVPGALAVLDPLQGGQGARYATWRIMLMVVLLFTLPINGDSPKRHAHEASRAVSVDTAE